MRIKINVTSSKNNKKTGQEALLFNNENLPINILSFWQWSNSELLGNALRGIFAEFIIASAIDILDSLREEWDAYDLVTKNGLKIEIKSSSYLQSWRQSKTKKNLKDLETQQKQKCINLRDNWKAL